MYASSVLLTFFSQYDTVSQLVTNCTSNWSASHYCYKYSNWSI